MRSALSVFFLALVLLVGSLSSDASAQNAATGFLDRTVTIAGEPYRYQVYVPGDYTPGAHLASGALSPWWRRARHRWSDSDRGRHRQRDPPFLQPLPGHRRDATGAAARRVDRARMPTWRSRRSIRPKPSSTSTVAGSTSPDCRWEAPAPVRRIPPPESLRRAPRDLRAGSPVGDHDRSGRAGRRR